MLKISSNLKDVITKTRKQGLYEKAGEFYDLANVTAEKGSLTYFREVISTQDRVTTIYDKRTRSTKDMLMFGSNNYLNLANHPLVFETIERDVRKYGTGIGGPPILNGYTKLHRQLEDKLSEIKQCESTLLYSSGYSANLAIPVTLHSKGDVFLYDELSHASLIDGLNKTTGPKRQFKHNSPEDLQHKIDNLTMDYKDLFVGVEGIYSMDGDSAPLSGFVEVAKKNNAILILDDAHGLGTAGKTGKGTAEMYDVEGDIDITLGTFSKSLAMSGGFISSTKEIINYFRYFSRPFLFSASMPIVNVSGVLAGLQIIESEPERMAKLKENVKYAHELLSHFDVVTPPEAGILSIRIPEETNIRELNGKIHDHGIFLNTIEYPAVPVEEQRIRISFMTNHTRQDIDYLAGVLEKLIG